MDEIEKFYETDKDFRDYVDRYMRNKDVKLSDVLRLRQTQLVAEMYKNDDAS